ncbi:delta-type opioid receptor-like [Stylophora pistillata]|uniref:delta-type opioid receptor-like n=1 Tax=Stylophora pistillata TaxID=50429 RepID=UPI000C043DE8|nr:delta-type opioid receptor-like [Stylophora pistillata]
MAISILHVVGNGIRYLATHEVSEFFKFKICNAFDSFCAFVALISLLGMTLERLYAIRWPFRHLKLKTRSYINGVASVWILAGVMFIFDFLSVFFHADKIYLSMASSIIVSLEAVSALVITCASYVLLRQRTRQNIPGIRAQQSKKLTNTLLIVTVVSVFCWLPVIIYSTVLNMLSITDVFSDFSYLALLTVKALQYANSVVNPILYVFRLPMFKLELHKRCSKFFPPKEFDDNMVPNQESVGDSIQRTINQGNVRVPAQRTNRDIIISRYFDTKL